MFPMARCSVPACGRLTVWDRPTCAAHAPDPAALAELAAARLKAAGDLTDLSLRGLRLGRLDLRGRRLDFCDCAGCALEEVDFSGARLRYVFFDSATLRSCLFRETDVAMCVFADADVDSCDFSGSELMQTSFLGARVSSSRFGDSDLYSSRFIAARFEGVDMRNCNLKEVHFDRADGSRSPMEVLAGWGVDARGSNANDAVFGGER